MGNQTGIEWTDATWNPWHGCHKVSAGCKNCYMFRDKARYGQEPNVVVHAKPSTFYAPLKWAEPRMVFTCSWSDWFIEEADEWRAEAWDVIRYTPHLTYQILTKRTERILDCLPDDWGGGYNNVWLVASVENQPTAETRIPELLQVPASVRGLSCEPLLGELDITKWLDRCSYCCDHGDVYPDGHRPERTLDWIIVGGESGADARPMHPMWVRELRDQCAHFNVPFFFKQWGEFTPDAHEDAGAVLLAPSGARRGWFDAKGNGVSREYDNDRFVVPMYHVGKKRAGRVLDGRTWDEMPEVSC